MAEKKKIVKVGICGTHGTGKTTAAYELAAMLKKERLDVSVVTEVARNCPYTINEGTTLQSQMWIFSKMLNEEIMAKSAVVICDRTLIDVYAYTYRLDKELAAAIEPLVTYWCKSYDALFFMEPNPVYDLKDGIRSTDKAFQDEIDKYIKGVLVKHHIETFPISLGLITWAEIIKKIIKEK